MLFVFQDWDKDLSGGITVDQMREIFRIYKVGGVSHEPTTLSVEKSFDDFEIYQYYTFGLLRLDGNFQFIEA